jgi:hypothetical protein
VTNMQCCFALGGVAATLQPFHPRSPTQQRDYRFAHLCTSVRIDVTRRITFDTALNPNTEDKILHNLRFPHICQIESIIDHVTREAGV